MTNINPLNRFLAPHRITSCLLRKMGADHATIVHKGKNESRRQTLQQLACRHKTSRTSIKDYGVMNDRPNISPPESE